MTNDLALRNALTNLPQLETDRLLLRKMRMEDADDMFAYASDPQVTRTLSWDTHLSLDDTRRFLQIVLNGYERGDWAGWGIEHREDGKFIGTIGYTTFSNGGYVGEIGYALARPYWGQGFMTEALRAVIDFGFRHMDLHRIEAVCMVDNVGSYRVMEKAGMTLEGILRERTYVKGRMESFRMYSILRREFKG